MSDPRAAGATSLGASLELPCGVVLKNRIAKAAMSDSCGDGAGGSTDEQTRLYEQWASGGIDSEIRK